LEAVDAIASHSIFVRNVLCCEVEMQDVLIRELEYFELALCCRGRQVSLQAIEVRSKLGHLSEAMFARIHKRILIWSEVGSTIGLQRWEHHGIVSVEELPGRFAR